MGPARNQRDVENQLRDAVRPDRARVQIGRISRFGLLEMSRQRLRPSLGESNHLVCPRCDGLANIRSVESLSLSILRLIGEEARKDQTADVIAQLPTDVATYLLNEKRDWIRKIEQREGIKVVLIANSDYETPKYVIRRVRRDQTELAENTGASYNLISSDESNKDSASPNKAPDAKIETPIVTTTRPDTPPPAPTPVVAVQGPGLFVRLWRALFGTGEAPKKKHQSRSSSRPRSSGNRKPGNRGGQSQSRRREGGRDRNRSDEQQRGRGGQNRDSRSRDNRNRNEQKPNQPAQQTTAEKPKPVDGNQEQQVKTGKSRNRRRRRPRGGAGRDQNSSADTNTTQQQSANTDQPATAQPGNEASQRSNNQPRRESGEQKQATRPPENQQPAATSQPTTSAPAQQSVQKTSPAHAAEQKPQPAQQNPGNDRKLPWESDSKPAKQDSTYSVWSSGSGGSGERRDR